MPQPPELSPDKRSAGQQASLALRQMRASLKQSLSSGDVSLPWAWSNAESAKGMKVIDLLTALPGIGTARANALLEAARIPERATVRACGRRQRERLFALLAK